MGPQLHLLDYMAYKWEYLNHGRWPCDPPYSTVCHVCFIAAPQVGLSFTYVLCNPYHDRSYLGEIRIPRIAWYVHIAQSLSTNAVVEMGGGGGGGSGISGWDHPWVTGQGSYRLYSQHSASSKQMRTFWIRISPGWKAV